MRDLLIVMSIVLASVVSPSPGLAQSSPPPFSISISAAQSTAKAGSEIAIQVVLTNVSDRDIRIAQDAGARAEFSYTINIKDEHGHARPETEYLAAVKGRNITRPGKPTLVQTYSVGWHTIKPGANLTDSVDLTKVYDLDQRGKYAVQVQRIDNVSKTVVKSNTITVTVSP